MHGQCYKILHVLVQVKPQCSVDSECLQTEVCHQGNCVDACRLKVCGLNARCIASNHFASCQCITGFEGNPESACYQCKYMPNKRYNFELRGLAILAFKEAHTVYIN